MLKVMVKSKSEMITFICGCVRCGAISDMFCGHLGYYLWNNCFKQKKPSHRFFWVLYFDFQYELSISVPRKWLSWGKRCRRRMCSAFSNRVLAPYVIIQCVMLHWWLFIAIHDCFCHLMISQWILFSHPALSRFFIYGTFNSIFICDKECQYWVFVHSAFVLIHWIIVTSVCFSLDPWNHLPEFYFHV